MKSPLGVAAITLLACTGGVTGTATLTTNAQAAPTVSAWATDVDRADLSGVIVTDGSQTYGSSGDTAYLPWSIYFGSVPAGTDCGIGGSSLHDDAASWLAEIDIALPYVSSDADLPEVALQPGQYVVAEVGSLDPVTQPSASIQIFPATFALDLLDAGTVTITAFDNDHIAGSFTATGSGATTTASATFDAGRCDF